MLILQPDKKFLMISKTNTVDIKGNMVTMMSVILRDTDLELIEQGLRQRVQQAPEFFKNTPVIVDFSKVSINLGFDFNSLFKLVRQHKLLPVAVRGVPPQLQERMQMAGVPVVEPAAPSVVSKNNGKRLRSGKSLLVEYKVDSAQECFAEDGDLVLVGDSDSSAELIADGSIHVYGTMRGRVLAGAHGDTDARIFCTSLQAELVSVAGHSRQLIEIPPELQNCPVQIRLSEQQVIIEPIGQSKTGLSPGSSESANL